MNYDSKKKNIKNTNNKKATNITKNNSNINGKVLLLLKQNWDIIELEFNSLIKKFENFNQYLKDSSIKKEFNSIISLFNNCKNNFKNIFFKLGLNIASCSKEEKDLNKSDKINTSYENIYSELMNIETMIKNVDNIQSKNKIKKKKQIENLEDKLHEYMDEVDKLDFNKIDKL